MLKSKFSRVKSFTLIETLIASGIIALLAAASAGLSISMIKSGSLAYKKMTAANLASEAVEAARWIRDKNYNDKDSATPWNSTRNAAVGDIYSCTDSSPCDISPLARSSLENSASGFSYQPGVGTVEIDGVEYTRSLYVEKDLEDENNSFVLTVSVDANGEKLAEVKAVLTNWKGNR